MKNFNTHKINFTKLINSIAEEDSSSDNKAKSFIESKGIDIAKLVTNGMKKIERTKHEETCSFDSIIKKLSMLGLDNKILEKIIPKNIRNQITNSNSLLPYSLNKEIFQYLERVFKITWNDFIQQNDLKLSNVKYQAAFFKTPSKANINQIRAYSHYAFYLAEIVNKVSTKNSRFNYPGDIDEFRSQFYGSYGELNFSNLVNFVWDLGIAVIPLNDSGVFHGASWNIENYHVIVLKQKSQSHARWIFDLLHELYHVFVHLENENTSVLEIDEMNPFRENDSIEEIEANSFSNQFIFNNEAENLAKESLELANNDLQFLKNAVEIVAINNNIRTDFLANYLAFRLQNQNYNWWGTANGFQEYEAPPFNIASDILRNRIPIENLDPIDKNLLITAIEY